MLNIISSRPLPGNRVAAARRIAGLVLCAGVLSRPAVAAPASVVTDHFEVTWTGTSAPPNADELTEDSRWLEAAYERVGPLLGFVPDRRVQVTLFATDDAYINAGGTGQAAAGSVVGDALLLTPDADHPQHTAVALTRLYTRYTVMKKTGGRAAPWLIDGIERYLSDGFTPSLETLAPAAHAAHLVDLGSGVISGAGAGTVADAVPAPANPHRGPGLEIPLSNLIPGLAASGEGRNARAVPGASGDNDLVPPAGGSLREGPAADLPASPPGVPLQDAEAVFAVYYLQAMVGPGTLSRLLEQIGQGKDWPQALKAAADLRPAEFDAAWAGMAREDVVAFSPPGEHVSSWSTTAKTVLDLPHPPDVGKPARIRITVGRTVLPLTDQVDALLVAGGDVDVQGTVTCRIGVLGGNLHIGPSARVAGQISVLGGTLTIDPGALVKAKVEVSSRSWNPTAVGGARQTLAVTIDRPMAMDLRLPGQSYITKEGPVTVPAGQTRDAAMAVGGTLVIDGTVTGRAVAIGGDVHLAAAPTPAAADTASPDHVSPEPALQLVAVGGDVLAQGHPVAASDNVTRMGNFDETITAPVQPGADPVPVYLGVGDTTIGQDQAYDAVLSVGGRCIVDGTVRGGLVVGGDVAGLEGSTLTGTLWVFGGHVRVQKGANVKGLVTEGDAAE